MKATNPLVVAAFVLAAGFFVPTSQARVKFTNLTGIYQGTYRLTSKTSDLSGTVVVLAEQSNHGNKVKLSIFGYFGATSTPPPTTAMVGVITLNSHHVLIADNVLLAYVAKIPANRTTFTGDHSPLTFTLTNADGTWTMSYTLRFNKSRLSISGSGSLAGTATSVTVAGAK